jgi:hypothetical protein
MSLNISSALSAANLANSASAHYLLAWCKSLTNVNKIAGLCQNDKLLSSINIDDEANSFKEILKTMLWTQYQTDSKQIFETLWEMIKREAKYADKYYVIYTAYPKKNEEIYLNICLDQFIKKQIKDIDTCLISKVYRADKDLIFSSLEDAFKNYIYTNKFINDHDKIMTDQFLSANLTIFGNKKTAESSMDRFLSSTKHDIDIEKYLPKLSNLDAPEKVINKLKAIANQNTAIMRQIFIRKEIAPNVGYVSTYYGYPFYSQFIDVKKDTSNTLANFQKGIYKPKEGGPFFDLTAKQARSVLSINQVSELQKLKSKFNDNDKILPAPDLFKIGTPDDKDVQFRIMYIPKYFLSDDILTFDSNYYPNQFAQEIKPDLNQPFTCPTVEEIIGNPAYNTQLSFFIKGNDSTPDFKVFNTFYDRHSTLGKLVFQSITLSEELGSPAMSCNYDYQPTSPSALSKTLNTPRITAVASTDSFNKLKTKIHKCTGNPSQIEGRKDPKYNTYLSPNNNPKETVIKCGKLF